MNRFGRSLGVGSINGSGGAVGGPRHPMPIPHSEDSETDEYNVIDSDRQYERIGDRGSSSTGTTSSSRSSNHNSTLVDPLILSSQHHHPSHNHHQLFNDNHLKVLSNVNTMNKMNHPQQHIPTHYAESAIYRRSRGLGSIGGSHQRGSSNLASPIDSDPQPLISESQLFHSSSNGGLPIQNASMIIDPKGWKSQHSTLEYGHNHSLQHHPHLQSVNSNHHLQQPSNTNTTILSSLDSTTNTSNATTSTSIHPSGQTMVYESACLMRTASGSLYIPQSDTNSTNKGAFKTPIQSINEFTIGGTIKKPDRLVDRIVFFHLF